jgi:hypothetical protein
MTNGNGRMCRTAAALALVAAGSITSAYAANGTTLLALQVSLDGQTWGDNVNLNLQSGESARVLMRARASYVPGADGLQPLGLASLSFQPVFSNVRPGRDLIASFASFGNDRTGGSVALDASPLDGPFGRLSPFAATGPVASEAYRVHTHTAGSGNAPSGTFYRIARGDVTRWMGTGPTTGSAAGNNQSGAGGIVAAQRLAARSPEDPPVSYDLSPTLFQIAIDVDGGGTRTIGLSAPTAGISRNTVNGNREGSWIRDMEDPFGQIKGDISVIGGRITIVPSPSGAALLALTIVGVAQRRRRG